MYGLFIANKTDTNTVETFRIGFWYKADDSKMALQIVPITLDQFERLFSAGFSSGTISPLFIQDFLRNCLAVSNYEAPAWKIEIERTVQEKIT
ncbi:MAG: AlwI family type II restriction endonuclease [Methylovulum sp.]|nr:AlwI family type II restriction endonuclease [Methylovulum sp.]